MPVRKKEGKWCVDVWIDHPDGERERIRRRSPYQTKKEAEEFEQELIEDALSIWSEPEERRFEDHALEFLKTYAKANNKHSEVVSKECILRVHLLPAFGDLLLTEIGSMVIERYKAAKLAKGLKPKTINNHLAVLRKALIIASEWGLLDRPPRVKQLKVARPPFDFLDHEEADRLVAAADGPFRTMIITACKTGLRLGELRALRWEDVDLVSKQLLVRQSLCRGKFGTPKSNRERVLPLCDSALFALKAERHLKGELVFCKDDGAWFTKSETYGGLQRACRLAGLRRIGWHVLRHTFASHLVMAGVPLKAVQELLGHANMEMTLRYAHLSPEARRQAVCALDRAPVLPQASRAPHGPSVGDSAGGSGWGGNAPDERAGIGSRKESAAGGAGGGASRAERPALRLAQSPDSDPAPFPTGGGEK